MFRSVRRYFASRSRIQLLVVGVGLSIALILDIAVVQYWVFDDPRGLEAFIEIALPPLYRAIASVWNPDAATSKLILKSLGLLIAVFAFGTQIYVQVDYWLWKRRPETRNPFL